MKNCCINHNFKNATVMFLLLKIIHKTNVSKFHYYYLRNSPCMCCNNLYDYFNFCLFLWCGCTIIRKIERWFDPMTSRSPHLHLLRIELHAWCVVHVTHLRFLRWETEQSTFPIRGQRTIMPVHLTLRPKDILLKPRSLDLWTSKYWIV